MSFSEKIAWIGCISLFTIGFIYVGNVLPNIPPQITPIELGKEVLPYMLALIAVMIIGSISAAISGPKEVDQPLDERDKLIDSRAASAHSFILPFLFTLTFVHTIFFGNFALFAALAPLVLIIGDFVRYFGQIVQYRHWV